MLAAMTSRDRVHAALRFQTTDRTPRDLAGMRSTGISAFAYPDLVRTLGLPPRLPRVYDVGQMLALPETDVLDALECDVVPVEMDDCTNAFDESDRWHEYDFGGRLPALVRSPGIYAVQTDGAVTASPSGRPDDPQALRMPTGSYVFDQLHGGQPIDFSTELVMEDLELVKERQAASLVPDERAGEIAAYCRRARSATTRAIMFNGLSARLGYPGGFPHWSMICLTEPDYVHAYHEIVTDAAVRQIETLLPRIADSIDLLMLAADDQGLQDRTILPPALFRELYVPYYRKVTDAVHRIAPEVKCFLHSCGAVYDLIDDFCECGFDVLNPVQWPAGGHTPAEWRSRAGRRLVLWGGGVNTQSTLPLGTIPEIRNEVRRTVDVLGEGSGFVFCAIHNLLAEIPGEKVVAMYGAVS
jgi:uroporphyrinogen decarboxylase